MSDRRMKEGKREEEKKRTDKRWLVCAEGFIHVEEMTRSVESLINFLSFSLLVVNCRNSRFFFFRVLTMNMTCLHFLSIPFFLHSQTFIVNEHCAKSRRFFFLYIFTQLTVFSVIGYSMIDGLKRAG